MAFKCWTQLEVWRNNSWSFGCGGQQHQEMLFYWYLWQNCSVTHKNLIYMKLKLLTHEAMTLPCQGSVLCVWAHFGDEWFSEWGFWRLLLFYLSVWWHQHHVFYLRAKKIYRNCCLNYRMTWRHANHELHCVCVCVCFNPGLSRADHPSFGYIGPLVIFLVCQFHPNWNSDHAHPRCLWCSTGGQS